MKSLEPLIFVAGALMVAAISAGITALYYRQRLRRASKESWAAARLYYTRRAASHVIR